MPCMLITNDIDTFLTTYDMVLHYSNGWITIVILKHYLLQLLYVLLGVLYR